jgi:hypothetical protein
MARKLSRGPRPFEIVMDKLALKSWAMRLPKHAGMKKAKVARPQARGDHASHAGRWNNVRLPLWRPDREVSMGFGRLCVVLFRVMRNRAAFGRPLDMPCKSACVLSYAAIGMPSLSQAILVPSTRDRIF